MFEIVVARCNENTPWIDYLEADRVTVYNKVGDWDLWPGSISLPNVGNGSYSFLTHIIERWNDLADVTAFLLGSLEKHAHHAVRFPIRLYNTVSQDPRIPICVHRLFKDPDWPGRIQFKGRWQEQYESGAMRPCPHSMGEWYERMGIGIPPKNLFYQPAEFFSVPKVHIRGRDKDFYRRLRDTISDHKNPEECHYLERMWLYIFGGNP